MSAANDTVAPEMTNVLDVETLNRLLDTMPPRETWASSHLFPADKAWRFAAPREIVTCAHPSYWAKLMASLPVARDGPFPVARDGPFGGHLAQPAVTNLDPHPADTEATAVWRSAERARIFRLLAQALRSTS